MITHENDIYIYMHLATELSDDERKTILKIFDIFESFVLNEGEHEIKASEEKFEKITSFFRDFIDYEINPESFEGKYWLDSHNIHKILWELFPNHSCSTRGLLELVAYMKTYFHCPKERQILEYKYESERNENDLMVLMTGNRLKNGEPVWKDREKLFHTYFLICESSSNIKIGRSINPIQRFHALRSSSPTPLKILGVIEKDVETELHRKFKKSRLQGEWFKSTPELLEYIKENAISYSDKKIADALGVTPIPLLLENEQLTLI